METGSAERPPRCFSPVARRHRRDRRPPGETWTASSWGDRPVKKMPGGGDLPEGRVPDQDRPPRRPRPLLLLGAGGEEEHRRRTRPVHTLAALLAVPRAPRTVRSARTWAASGEENPSPRGSRRSKRELPAASGWSLMRSTTPSPATVRGSDAPPVPTRSGCSSRSLWTVLSVCWHCRSNDRTRQIAPRAGRRPEGLRATPPHDSTPRQAHVDSGNPGRRTGGHLRIFRRCPFGIQVRHQRRRSLTTGAPLEQAGPCD